MAAGASVMFLPLLVGLGFGVLEAIVVPASIEVVTIVEVTIGERVATVLKIARLPFPPVVIPAVVIEIRLVPGDGRHLKHPDAAGSRGFGHALFRHHAG